MVARETDTNRSESRRLSVVGKREVAEERVQQPTAALEKVEHGVEEDEEVQQEEDGAAGQGGEALEEETSGPLDHLAERRDDRLPVRLDVGENRQALHQALFQHRGLRGVLLDPRNGDLADVQGVGGHQAEEGGERQADREHENDQREGGRERALSRHLSEQPGVERMSQSAEDRGEDQGDQEALDHVEKQRRYGDREEEEEAAAVELLITDHGCLS